MRFFQGSRAAVLAVLIASAATLIAGASQAGIHGGRWSGGGYGYSDGCGWGGGGHVVRYRHWGGGSWGGRCYGGGYGYYRPYYHSRPRTYVRFGIGFGSPGYYCPPRYGYYIAPRPTYVVPRSEYVRPDRDDDGDDDSDRVRDGDEYRDREDSDRDQDRSDRVSPDQENHQDLDQDRSHRISPDRLRAEGEFDVTNEPPTGSYFFDRFCNRRFDNLDDYTDHLHDKHHTQTIEIIDRDSHRTIRTLEFVDGLWQVQER